MIENISYEDMDSFSKELKASADVIRELIENKDYPDLENFVGDVNNYSRYLENTVKLYKSADEALEDLNKQNRVS